MKSIIAKTGEQARKIRSQAPRMLRAASPKIANRAFDPVAYAAVLEILG